MILLVNGSYRKDGITDQTLEVMTQEAKALGFETETVFLRDFEIKFCLNCRNCTQELGETPGECVLKDQMDELIEKIEICQYFVFASPTNDYTVTAVYKRFLERLVVYGYWPWGTDAPKYRKKTPSKRAVILSSTAMPGFLGRIFTNSLKLLDLSSRSIGAKTVDSMFIGLVSYDKNQKISDATIKKARKMMMKLLDFGMVKSTK